MILWIWWLAILAAHALQAWFAVATLAQVARRPPGRVPGGVSVILPIFGLDPGAARHWRAWLEQSPGIPYEVIFSLQDPRDEALPVLRELFAAHPATPARIIINPLRPGLNGKASNLWHGVRAAGHDLLVMADSDVHPPPELLPKLVSPLAAPAVGIVACVPVARQAGGLWGRLTALALNGVLVLQWAPGVRLGVPMGVSGACFALRRATLDAIGGVEAFGRYVAEDARLGLGIRALGLQVVLGPPVSLEVGNPGREALFSLLSRGAYMFKRMFPLTLGLLSLATVVGLPGLAVTAWWLRWQWVASMAAGLLIARWLAAAAVAAACERRGWWHGLLIPLLDAAMIAVTLRALFTDTVTWRGIRYRVLPGGLVRRLP